MQEGDRIGKWLVIERLGTGGSADVYRCRSDGRVAAIKLLRTAVADNPQAVRRLQREGEILTRLQHPNVVRIRSVEVEQDPVHIEMDFVPGRHCGFLVRAGPSSVRTATAVGTQLFSAMSYWHSRGVAHRDLKPGNVIVGPDHHVTVVDFGLALDGTFERLSGIGVRVGTCAYAPPEWTSDDEADPTAWDVYGAGQILCELLAGRRMFDHRASMIQLVQAKLAQPALDPGPRVPDPLRVVVRELTATDPAARPRDGAAAAALLASAVAVLGPAN